jgi:hypothetical protein
MFEGGMGMIEVYPAESRYTSDLGWLRSHLSFSFGEYYDAKNANFSVMRVCNDDFLAPNRGFGAHPHSDMEIVSVVLSGSIRHEDNLGHVAISSFGEVQRMSAGTGVIHTEHNPSSTGELNLLQMWFEPHTRGLEPSYQTSRFDLDQLQGRLLPIVSQHGSENVASIQQDLTIYLSKLAAGEHIAFDQSSSRKTYLFVIDGACSVNGKTLLTRDAARVEQESGLSIVADQDVFFMLIDLP